MSAAAGAKNHKYFVSWMMETLRRLGAGQSANFADRDLTRARFRPLRLRGALRQCRPAR
jgi:hypothetical protein